MTRASPLLLRILSLLCVLVFCSSILTRFLLLFLVMPQIIAPPNGYWYHVNESDSFVNLCQATAWPTPSVSWTTNNNTHVLQGDLKATFVTSNSEEMADVELTVLNNVS